MTKLQAITRSDGSIVYTICIPKGYIDELGWAKGMNLVVGLTDDVITIQR